MNGTIELRAPKPELWGLVASGKLLAVAILFWAWVGGGGGTWLTGLKARSYRSYQDLVLCFSFSRCFFLVSDACDLEKEAQELIYTLIYVCTCMYIYTYTSVRVHIYIYIYTCIHT